MDGDLMCGRFSLTASPADVQSCFALAELPQVAARYNVAPSQRVAAIRPRAGGGRELVLLDWGLIPAFTRDLRSARRPINARAETLTRKPSFARLFSTQRCLIAADGFYEWRKEPTGGKTPFYVRLRQGGLFAFAGLWDRFVDASGACIESCAIVTTDANAVVRPLHDRMPVILEPQAFELWLDPTAEIAQLEKLLVPPLDSALVAHPVSRIVNRPANDVPDCIVPAPLEQLELLPKLGRSG